MSKAKVIGTRFLDFADSKGGQIKGTQIFIVHEDEHTNGLMSDKIFVSADSKIQLPVFKFGTEYDFVYDVSGFSKYPKLVAINPVS